MNLGTWTVSAYHWICKGPILKPESWMSISQWINFRAADILGLETVRQWWVHSWIKQKELVAIPLPWGRVSQQHTGLLPTHAKPENNPVMKPHQLREMSGLLWVRVTQPSWTLEIRKLWWKRKSILMCCALWNGHIL